jgi:hypothetical protein
MGMSVKTKPKDKPILQSVAFPPDIRKRIQEDAEAANRSFSGQVRYLLDIALKEVGK